MYNLEARKLNYHRAATFGALAIAAVAFSTSAAASPLPLFPFIMTPPTAQMQPAPQVAPQSQDEGTVVDIPARLKRQIVSYATREAPGTIIIDTPNTYLYYVLGGGQAIRYGIGVGRDGQETPQGMLAAQIRMQGFACDKPQSAVKDAKRSKPDHAVWILKCSDATYRISRVPDMAAKVERLR